MMEAMQIGLSGMQAAQSVAATRAANIANLDTKGYVPVEPAVQSSGDGGVQASASQPGLSPEMAAFLANIPMSPVDLANELAQLRMAQIAYAASAKVVSTASRMQDTALKTIR
jgi:flagellar hook protein FlgE